MLHEPGTVIAAALGRRGRAQKCRHLTDIQLCRDSQMKKSASVKSVGTAVAVKQPSDAPATNSDDRRNPRASLPAHEAIELCAYLRWEAAGRPAGDGVDFWLAAEDELAHRPKP